MCAYMRICGMYTPPIHLNMHTNTVKRNHHTCAPSIVIYQNQSIPERDILLREAKEEERQRQPDGGHAVCECDYEKIKN